MLRTIVLLSALPLMAAACATTRYEPQSVEVVDPGPPQRVPPAIKVVDDGVTPRRPYRLSLIHISEPTRLWSGSRMPSSA